MDPELIAFLTKRGITPQWPIILEANNCGSWGYAEATLKQSDDGKYTVHSLENRTGAIMGATDAPTSEEFIHDTFSQALQQFLDVCPVSEDQLFNDPNYYGGEHDDPCEHEE
jgi:hypothetical protein